MPSVIAPLATSVALDDEREHRADRHRALHGPPQADERPLPAHRAAQHPAAVLDEAPHGVHAGAVGPQVLRGREALLDAAVQLGQRAHLVGRLVDRPVPHRQQHGDGEAEVDEHAEAEAPVEHRQHAEHPGDQQHAADGLGHDLRQEVGHRRDVAVDALDQLAGRVGAVELVVEAEHVAGHAQAQLVRRAPRRDRRVADDDDADDLGDDGDGEEHQGERRRTSTSGRRRWPGRRSCARRAGRRARAPTTPRGARRGRPNAERRAAAGRSGRAHATAESSAPGQSPAGTAVPTRWFRAASGLVVASAAAQYAGRSWRTTPRPSSSRHRRRRRSSRRSCSSRRSRSTACAASTDARPR